MRRARRRGRTRDGALDGSGVHVRRRVDSAAPEDGRSRGRGRVCGRAREVCADSARVSAGDAGRGRGWGGGVARGCVDRREWFDVRR